MNKNRISYGKSVILTTFSVGILIGALFLPCIVFIPGIGNTWIVFEFGLPILISAISSFIINNKSFKFSIANIKNRYSILKFIYQMLGVLLFFFIGYMVDMSRIFSYININSEEYGWKVESLLGNSNFYFLISIFLFVFVFVDYIFITKKDKKLN